MTVKLYDIDYYKERLNVLDTFDEGEFEFADVIDVKRYYASCKTHPDPTMFAFVTKISHKTERRGAIAMIHGFAQTSDVFIEGALQYALNGFEVYTIDLEGFGYTGGNRINLLNIEKFHHQVTTLLEQVPSDLPVFLFGHSMGGLTVNTYL